MLCHSSEGDNDVVAHFHGRAFVVFAQDRFDSVKCLSLCIRDSGGGGIV